MMEWAGRYIDAFIGLSLEMAPWLLLGFIFAGILHVYMPEGSIRKYMGGKNLKSVIYSSLLGIPLPLCSCGVIPTGIAFYKEGASKGSTVSFLISTPQTGVDSILATYSLLGLPFAVLRPVVAFLSGIFGGAVTNSVTSNDSDQHSEKPASYTRSFSGTKGKLSTLIRYAFFDFLGDIAKWLLIGLAIAALIDLALPDDFFVSYLHNELLSMLIVLTASIPIYVCATGSIPIAAILMMKGLSPGAALVFLMAGPATNTATMAVIANAIDKKTLFTYLATIVGAAMAFGWLTNMFLPREWFTFALDHAGHQHELLPYWLKLASGIILLLLILNIFRTKLMKKKTNINQQALGADIVQMKISVGGMTCNHCKMNVEKGLLSIQGINFAQADPDNSEVIVHGKEPDIDKIKHIIDHLGYQFKGVMK